METVKYNLTHDNKSKKIEILSKLLYEKRITIDEFILLLEVEKEYIYIYYPQYMPHYYPPYIVTY
jgi:hypothetical protein